MTTYQLKHRLYYQRNKEKIAKKHQLKKALQRQALLSKFEYSLRRASYYEHLRKYTAKVIQQELSSGTSVEEFRQYLQSSHKLFNVRCSPAKLNVVLSRLDRIGSTK